MLPLHSAAIACQPRLIAFDERSLASASAEQSVHQPAVQTASRFRPD